MNGRETTERRRICVQGIVQGVGFRPFIYGLATRLGLTGFVGNDSSGVFIEVQGEPGQLDVFTNALQSAPPPLAHIERISVHSIPLEEALDFAIAASQPQTAATTLISPDLSICDSCLAELLDPNDRRYRYPFINCTNCGPRFTITRDIPYDRPLTTMAPFVMCTACQTEYDNPLDRRFHAQPNACAACGPQLWLERSNRHHSSSGERLAAGDTAIVLAQRILTGGGIVAVKGLGGFHLACDATDDGAVRRLRQRKGRANKPFAIMVADLTSARTIAHVSEHEETLLTSRQRPIVLLEKRMNGLLSPSVAPGNRSVGIMLPYTPLHHLLFHSNAEDRGPRDTQPATLKSCSFLVVTSANFSDQPIIKENDEALEKLAPIADAFLLHDRKIHVHCDDSVVRIFQGGELPIRRARGYAPFPVKLPFALRPTLAVGGELKSTFCLASGNHAFMSQHIGDVGNLETLATFSHAVQHFKDIFRIEPEIVACDPHPAYLSTRWAREKYGARALIPIQHHHAHIAAVMAENDVAQDEQVIGFAFDGTGYGCDGTIWGGEMFVGGYANFQRVAHLATVPIAGGDASIHKPYRMALAHLWAAGVEWAASLPPVIACSSNERGVLQQQLERRLNTVETSSMGRLFDAVAALAGGPQTVSYEAQAAIEFEAMADRGEQGSYAFDIPISSPNAGEPLQIGAKSLICAVAEDVQRDVSTGAIATRFHRAVADLIVRLARRTHDATGLTRVALSGGVFQNVLLLELTVEQLERDNFTVLIHKAVPPNDGGLALGQAVIANCILEGR